MRKWPVGSTTRLLSPRPPKSKKTCSPRSCGTLVAPSPTSSCARCSWEPPARLSAWSGGGPDPRVARNPARNEARVRRRGRGGAPRGCPLRRTARGSPPDRLDGARDLGLREKGFEVKEPPHPAVRGRRLGLLSSNPRLPLGPDLTWRHAQAPPWGPWRGPDLHLHLDARPHRGRRCRRARAPRG